MNRQQIELWLEHELHAYSDRINTPYLSEKLMPLFAQMWEEGFESGQAFGELPFSPDQNPYEFNTQEQTNA